MHFVYIIYSKKIDKYYVGETPDVANRLLQHNEHYFPTNFTKSASDWKLFLKLNFETKEDAQKAEKFIKKMKSRKFIEKIIENPDLLQQILKK